MWLKATKIYTKCYIAASNLIFYLLLFHFTPKFKYSINYCSCYLWANDLVISQKASQKTKCSHMQRNAETNFKLRFSSSYMQSTTLNMINAIRLKTTTPTRSILSTFSQNYTLLRNSKALNKQSSVICLYKTVIKAYLSKNNLI